MFWTVISTYNCGIVYGWYNVKPVKSQ